MSTDLLVKLNIALKEHPNYTEGMEFLKIDKVKNSYVFGATYIHDEKGILTSDYPSWNEVYQSVATSVLHV